MACVLQVAEVAGGADRQGRAGPEDRRGHLPQGRQGHHRARRGQAGLPPRRSRRGAGSGRDPEDQESGGEVRQAAREPASAGAVPVGDVPRPVPLQRLSPGRHRRHRARRRPGDPLGLRLVARPVRDLAGRRLEAGGAVDRRGHRRRQEHEQRAAAELGVRRSRRRACRRGQLQPGARRQAATFVAAGVSPPALPRSAAGREVQPGRDGVRERRPAHVA